MAIIRACSYEATITLPEDPANYSSILITFQQDGTNLIEKTEDSAGVTLDSAEQKVVVKLDQTETKQFACANSAFLQIRCYKSQYEAPGSMIWKIPVYPVLNDEVLT